MLTEQFSLEKLNSILMDSFSEEFLLKVEQDDQHPLGMAYREFRSVLREKEETGDFEMTTNLVKVISIVTYINKYKSLDIYSEQLTKLNSNEVMELYHKQTIERLKKKDTFIQALFEIMVPFFLAGTPLKLSPIMEGELKTPDYLVDYLGKRCLLECKCGDYDCSRDDQVIRKTERHISRGKKQFIRYRDIPGMLFIHINNVEYFRNDKIMIESPGKKITEDASNLAAVVFLNYEVRVDPFCFQLHYLPLLNLRTTKLLPKGLKEAVFGGHGKLVLNARKGERFIIEKEDGRINAHPRHGVLSMTDDMTKEEIVSIRDIAEYYGVDWKVSV